MSIQNKILLLIAFCVLNIGTYAQSQLALYTDFGRNSVSKGLYLQPTIFGRYEDDNQGFEAGFQLRIGDKNSQALNGYRFSVNEDFPILHIPARLQVFVVSTGNSMIRELNAGITLGITYEQLCVTFGGNFKQYSYTTSARTKYGIAESYATLDQIFNFLYDFVYYLNPLDSKKWNFAARLTNNDRFIYNQETNPAFVMIMHYRFKLPITASIETWFIPSGLSNLRPDWFGYFLRGGLSWEIL